RVLAVRTATSAADRRHGRDFLDCDRRRRSCDWSRDGHRGLSPLPHHQRGSARSAQRMSSWITHNVWLIPVTPIVVALFTLSIGKHARMTSAMFAVLGQVAALAMSILVFIPTLHSHGFRVVENFTWFTFGDQSLRIGFVLDPLAAAMMAMITLVGLCIFV